MSFLLSSISILLAPALRAIDNGSTKKLVGQFPIQRTVHTAAYLIRLDN
jgi:hypothetical protein